MNEAEPLPGAEVTDHVSSTIEPPVAIVRMERAGQLNALTYPMLAAIRRAIDAAVRDPAVVGIVVTGSGRGFSAGLDMAALAASAASGDASAGAAGVVEGAPQRGELPALFSYILDVPKPVVAAVNGVAAGGGFVLAMMCDLRFAAARGASFTTVFGKRGLVAEHGTSWLLPRLVGTSRALDLLWSSRRIDADEALRIGLVDRVVPDDELVAAACDYVRGLAESVAPRSLALMKQQVLRGWSQPIDVALREVDADMQASLGHPDASEGVAAFLERRPPQFAPWPPAAASETGAMAHADGGGTGSEPAHGGRRESRREP